MKVVIIFALIFIGLNANAQSFRFHLAPDSTILYENVISLDSTYKKEVLYKTAKTWFVNTFRNSKEVIQSEDFNSGRIIGKGFIQTPTSIQISTDIPIGVVGENCYFTIQIDIKDGKYRYKVFDIYTDGRDTENSYFKNNLNEVYFYYWYSDFKKMPSIKKERIYANYKNAFTWIDLSINSLIGSLYTDMKNSKKDDF